MLDHGGHRRIRYEDVFRAVGHFLDEHQSRHLAMMETPEGFLVKAWGRPFTPGAALSPATNQTFLLSNEDIDALLEAAYQRRGAVSTQRPATPSTRPSFWRRGR